MEIQEIIRTLHEGMDDLYKPRPARPARTIHASSLGVPCDLYQVRQFLDWDKAEPPDPHLLRIFQQGMMIEEYWIAKAREKWRIYDEQQPLEWKKYNIAGRLEGRIELPLNGDKQIVAFEIKSIHPATWAKFDETPETWRKFFSMPYYARWPGQGQIYMLAGNEPMILFILVNKSNLQEKFLPMSLDFEYGEELIKRAERVNKHLKDGTRPQPILYDENICGKICPWAHICQPDKEIKGADFLDDEDLQEAAAVYLETKENADEYAKSKKLIHARCKGIEHAFLGTDYELTGKNINVKGSPEKLVPAKEASTRYQFNLRKLDGKDGGE